MGFHYLILNDERVHFFNFECTEFVHKQLYLRLKLKKMYNIVYRVCTWVQNLYKTLDVNKGTHC